VVKRVLEMDSMTGTLVITGGVIAHNPYLAELIKESFGKEVLVPKDPQLIGALGAALFALEDAERGE
jgi:activator of 2-hydroxyglutaryl-CoA dehydratase